MRTCNLCFTSKDISEFKPVPTANGHALRCKECYAKVALQTSRTKLNVIKAAYKSQLSSSKRRGHTPPEYTLEELVSWVMANDDFHRIYDDWKKSGYDRNDIPSCDRHSETQLDYDYLPYSLDRLVVVTWRDNNLKSDRDIKNGINNKISKKVIQYDKEMNYIKTHYSISSAARELGGCDSPISQVCKFKRKSHLGYIWRYA